MNPLNYINENCWLNVCKFLSAEDKQALCETCVTFHSMLQPQKAEWAFGLILPRIMELPDLRYIYDNRSTQLKSVLNMRLVCKSWKSAFDDYCGSWNGYYDSKGDTIANILCSYDFDEAQKLEKFVDVFKNHTGNPFVGRGVTIYATSPRTDEATDQNELPHGSGENELNNESAEQNVANPVEKALSWRAQREKNDREFLQRNYNLIIMELMPKHGSQIDYIYLRNSFEAVRMMRKMPCPSLASFKFLQKVLCNTPNLQILTLNLPTFFNRKEESSNELKTALAEYFASNPFPKLPRLRTLKTYVLNTEVEKMILETYGHTLQSLFTYTLEIPASVLDNMTSLRKLILWGTNFESTERMLRALQSPLEELSVCGDHMWWQREFEPSKFFAIDKFLLAVQHLPLKKIVIWPDSGILKESVPFPPDFPKHLTIQEFSVQRGDSLSFNFLQFLPQLRILGLRGCEILFPKIS